MQTNNRLVKVTNFHSKLIRSRKVEGQRRRSGEQTDRPHHHLELLPKMPMDQLPLPSKDRQEEGRHDVAKQHHHHQQQQQQQACSCERGRCKTKPAPVGIIQGKKGHARSAKIQTDAAAAAAAGACRCFCFPLTAIFFRRISTGTHCSCPIQVADALNTEKKERK